MTEKYGQTVKVLFTEDEIKHAVNQLGKRISFDYRDKDLLVVGVLKGSFVFMADLVRKIDLPFELDFIKLHSYKGISSSGNVSLDLDISYDLEGKDILIVEDMLDTGKTLKKIYKSFSQRNARSVKSAVLLDKPSRRTENICADYRCFEIPDSFVVGYGLDFDERFRALPYIAKLY